MLFDRFKRKWRVVNNAPAREKQDDTLEIKFMYLCHDMAKKYEPQDNRRVTLIIKPDGQDNVEYNMDRAPYGNGDGLYLHLLEDDKFIDEHTIWMYKPFVKNLATGEDNELTVGMLPLEFALQKVLCNYFNIDSEKELTDKQFEEAVQILNNNIKIYSLYDDLKKCLY